MVSIKFELSLPKKTFASKGWLNEISRAQRRNSVPGLRKLFNQTTFGWSKKPSFGWSQSRSADELSITMYPQGLHADIWELLNAGSPRHDITPKKGFLKFRPGYRAATTPGSLQSRRAYRSGKHVSARRVNHPGFEARRFTEVIADEYENQFVRDMQDAFDNAARS